MPRTTVYRLSLFIYLDSMVSDALQCPTYDLKNSVVQSVYGYTVAFVKKYFPRALKS